MAIASIRDYPGFHTLCKGLCASEEQHMLVCTHAYENLGENRSDDANLIRSAFWYHQIYLTEGGGAAAARHSHAFINAAPSLLGKVNEPPQLSTRRLYTFYFVQALHCLRRNKHCGEKRALGEAMRILVASNIFPELKLPESPSNAAKTSPARLPGPRDIIWPDEMAKIHRFDQMPPTLEEMRAGIWSVEEMAIRVLSIVMVHGWQRFRSMRLVELQHIICGVRTREGIKSLDVIIPDSKGGRLMIRSPISLLAPPSETEFLQNFSTFATGRFLPIKRLTELAGFGKIERSGRNAKAVYKPAFLRMGGTHDPRRSGLSFAPIRALLARRPDLIDHPLFPERLKTHCWFTPDALLRFRQLVPADQTDAAEIIRRIAGWRTYTQLFTTYCRTWHILLALHMPPKIWEDFPRLDADDRAPISERNGVSAI